MTIQQKCDCVTLHPLRLQLLHKGIKVTIWLIISCMLIASCFAVHFFQGIVDICLTAASKRDPQGLALHFYKNGEPPEDQLGRDAFSTRYKLSPNKVSATDAIVYISFSNQYLKKLYREAVLSVVKGCHIFQKHIPSNVDINSALIVNVQCQL